MNRLTLIEELTILTEHFIDQAESLKKLPAEALRERSAPESWNALECLEHLNRYGDFYLPAIETALTTAPDQPEATQFSSGWLGGYFTRMIQLPKQGKLKTINSPKDYNPLGADLSLTVLDRFIKQQYKMLDLLKWAKRKNLQKAKTPISISNWVRLRLGDTFRFVIFHNERHMDQVRRILEEQEINLNGALNQ